MLQEEEEEEKEEEEKEEEEEEKEEEEKEEKEEEEKEEKEEEVEHSAISVTLLLLRCASSCARSESYEQRAAAPLITNMDLPPHWTLASVLWMLLIGAAEDCLGEEVSGTPQLSLE
ncbi:unnamed protein product [Arctogadus glacialis]